MTLKNASNFKYLPEKSVRAPASSLLVFAAFLVLSGTAGAQQLDQGELTVSMNVPVECSIENSSLELPTYDGSDSEASTEITVFCTAQQILDINFTGSATRTLRNGFSELDYFLFADPETEQPLHPGVGLERVAIVGGESTDFRIFARIPGGQTTSLLGGTYSDTVVMTLTL